MKTILFSTRKHKRLQITKAIPREKNVVETTASAQQLHFRATVTKPVWCWHITEAKEMTGGPGISPCGHILHLPPKMSETTS